MSPGSAALLLLVLFCAGIAAIDVAPPVLPVEEEALGKPLPVSKPGVCPTDLEYPPCKIPMKPLCFGDKSCTGTMKCCLYDCRYQCVLPLGSKMGSCPYFDKSTCKKSLISRCHSDNQCPGTHRCCYYKCQYQCMPAVFGFPVDLEPEVAV